MLTLLIHQNYTDLPKRTSPGWDDNEFDIIRYYMSNNRPILFSCYGAHFENISYYMQKLPRVKETLQKHSINPIKSSATMILLQQEDFFFLNLIMNDRKVILR